MLKPLGKGLLRNRMFGWCKNITLGLLSNCRKWFSFSLEGSGGPNEALIYKMDILIVATSESVKIK